MRKRLKILTIMLLLTVVAVAANTKFTLVIDAGHGGGDAGAVGSITKEKAINLNVALAFGRLVERNCPDVKVVYTRKTDVFVPLHTRADIANRNKADLFISIHTNALPKGRISRGLETYTLGMHRAADNLDVAKRENAVILIEKDYKQRYQGFDPNSAESYIMFEFIQDRNMAKSVELARYVQRRTCASAGRQNKGVKQAGFLVLRETSMPSCLIELGFISTPDEEQFLSSQAGVDKLASGIYQAFVDYKQKNHVGFTVPYKAEEKKSEVNIPAVVPPAISDEPQKVASEESKPVVSQTPQPVVSQTPQQVTPVVPDTVKQNTAAVSTVNASSSAPVFKVQVLASGSRLKAGDTQLKGLEVDCYQENGLYKYTVGATTNFNEANQLRKQLAERFPQAFVIAFKNGQKTDVREAIREFRNNRAKK